MPRVTIGLPVYNGEAYVELAVRSLLSQTFTDFELIIADNASTDDTPGICQRIASDDARVRFLKNEQNIGGWRNHNLVLQEADTEFFMWAGHDDIWLPDSLARCVDLLEKDERAVMAFVGVKRIDGDGNPVEFDYVVPDFDSPLHSERFREAIRLDYSLELFYGLMRSEAIKRTAGLGQFSDSDRVLISELALMGRFSLIDDPLFLRRDHEGRSIRKFKSRQARNEWINPGHSSARGMPFHRELWEFAKRVSRSRISILEKTRCFRHLAGWAIRHRRALKNDCRNLIRSLIKKS